MKGSRKPKASVMANQIFHDSFNLKRHALRTSSESGRPPAAPVICYITQANNHVFNVEVENRSEGQEVMDKICKMLGLTEEAEYFGMQFTGSKNELLWVNNRNRLSKQIHSSPPYHLFFKVKFYIPPDAILLEETRHQFYINVVNQLKSGIWDADTSLETQAQLIALMAYVEFGNYNPKTTPCKYACFWPDCRGEIPPEAIRMAANHHQNLEGTLVSTAKYELLKRVSDEFPSYGAYFYDIKDVFDHKLSLGVGPNDLFLCNASGSVLERFLYCRVQTVTTSARVVTLSLLEDDGTAKNRNYQLLTNRLANALYRSITEMHAFFRCDTIREYVLGQTTRDLKDALVSIFDHNGKDYAFDVRYTFQEVYDRARRHLYQCASNTSQHGSPSDNNLHPNVTLSSSMYSITSGSGDSHGKSTGDHRKADRGESVVSEEEVQELVQERLREAALCRVCMDNPISRVFFPCGHTICCADCAERVGQCPICRTNIELRHACYLPWSIECGIDSVNLLLGSTSKDITHRFSTHRSNRIQKFEVCPTSTSSALHITASAPSCQLSSFPSTAVWATDRSHSLEDDNHLNPDPGSVNTSISSLVGTSLSITLNAPQPPNPTPGVSRAESVPPQPSSTSHSVSQGSEATQKDQTNRSNSSRHVTWQTED